MMFVPDAIHVGHVVDINRLLPLAKNVIPEHPVNVVEALQVERLPFPIHVTLDLSQVAWTGEVVVLGIEAPCCLSILTRRERAHLRPSSASVFGRLLLLGLGGSCPARLLVRPCGPCCGARRPWQSLRRRASRDRGTAARRCSDWCWNPYWVASFRNVKFVVATRHRRW